MYTGKKKKKRIIFCEDLYAVSVRSSQHLSTYVIGKRHAEINTTLLHLEIGKAWEATAPTSSQHGRAELQSWENMYWKCVTMCTEKLPQHTLSSTGQKHIRNRVLPGARRNGVLPTALTYRHKGWGSHLWGCHLRTRSKSLLTSGSL